MSNRVWMGAGLLALGAVCYWGIAYVVAGSSGDQEFQKTLEALKHVKSFRVDYTATDASGHQTGKLWEVDCSRQIFHQQLRDVQAGANPPFEVKEDELRIGTDRYKRQLDGSWEKLKDNHVMYSGQWYCENIAQATLRDLLPDVRAMLRSAMIGKIEQKTVDGVRCQDWKFVMKSSTSGQQGSVCTGLEDHLPYEMTLENTARYSYSGYNRPIEFDAPEAILESANSSAGAN